MTQPGAPLDKTWLIVAPFGEIPARLATVDPMLTLRVFVDTLMVGNQVKVVFDSTRASFEESLVKKDYFLNSQLTYHEL